MEALIAYWPYLAVLAVLAGLWIWSAVKKARFRRERDKARTLETLLQPRETVRCICPQRSGRWILTSKRLIIEEKNGYTALPFGKIKRLTGKDASGKATTAPAKMASVTVKADREFTLHSGDEAFVELVRQLKTKTAKKKPRKK